MAHFTGELKTLNCTACNQKTLHEALSERKTSAAKIIGGLATGGWSLPFTGFKSDLKSYICSRCGAVH